MLNLHAEFTKDPKLQVLPQNQIAMTTLEYYYLIDKQYNNLFQLLKDTKNMEL